MDAKKKAQETIHAYQQILIARSHRIHDHSELGFAEEQASRWITEVELLDLRARVTRCFEAGALATGAHLSIVGGDKPYAHMVQNAALAVLYRRNAEALGRVVQEAPRSGGA